MTPLAYCALTLAAALFIARIVAELDWRLWTRLTGEHGKPLMIELR